MKYKNKEIQAGEFKAKCLKIMDEVNEKHISYVITKHGVPVAQLIPIDDTPVDLFGSLKDKILIKSDIVAPIDEKWEADE